MRLSWNEIRTRAADFAREWADAAYEKGDTQTFYNEFFEIFGKRRRDVARYEERVQRLDNTAGFIDHAAGRLPGGRPVAVATLGGRRGIGP